MRCAALEVDGPAARNESVNVDFDQRSDDDLRVTAQLGGARVALGLLSLSLAAPPDHRADERCQPQPRHHEGERWRELQYDQWRKNREDDLRARERLKTSDLATAVLLDMRK